MEVERRQCVSLAISFYMQTEEACRACSLFWGRAFLEDQPLGLLPSRPSKPEPTCRSTALEDVWWVDVRGLGFGEW